jgi:hypothetical protein
MNKADKIEKLIRAGATVADVVKKLKVSKSYVYVVIHARMGKTENLKVKKAKQPIDTCAQEWAKKNPWFGKDIDKTAFALRMHEKLVKKGVDPESVEYYKKVDASLHYFDTQKKEVKEDIGGIEVIDFIEAKGLGYNLGNVVKYVSRAGSKDDALQDLQKARWYLNREIGRME